MNRELIAYFSVSGVTAKVAKEIAAVKGADCFEIKPEAPYTPKDVDWRDPTSRCTVEMKDLNCRPRLSTRVENMADYGVVFVGFPIWWGREPSAVDTFLTAYDFSGKKIVPFCTSGGSGIEKATERIRSLVGEGACVDDGKRLGGEVSEEDLKLWTEGL